MDHAVLQAKLKSFILFINLKKITLSWGDFWFASIKLLDLVSLEFYGINPAHHFFYSFQLILPRECRAQISRLIVLIYW